MRILLVSNMYPDAKHPTYGVFVKRFCEELEKLNIPYIKCVMNKRDSILGKAIAYLKFYVETFFNILFLKYDVVYVHYASHSGIPVLAASLFRKVNVFTNVHGSDVVPENSKQEKMQKYTVRLLKNSTKVIVPSEYFKSYVQQKYGIQNNKLFVYPSGGIDCHIFYQLDEKKKKNIKEEYGFNSSFPTFGMAGRISAGKGWDIFIKAVEIANNKGMKANFIIVGDGPEAKQLDILSQKISVDKLIKRVGLLPQDKLSEFYNAIDFFVFPTKREGESLGLVAVEAMACGASVIASDYAAPKDYVVDGVNGYKFNVDNPEDLLLCMERCEEVFHSENMAKLKLGALETAKRYYADNILNDLIQIFEC